MQKSETAKTKGASADQQRTLAFGEVDLGGGDEPLPEMALQESPAPPPAVKPGAKPAGPAARTAPAVASEPTPAAPEPPSPPAEKERPYIRVHSAAPRRDHSKLVRLLLITLAGLAILAGAVFGVMKYIESRRLAQEEEIKNLDRASLDRLKNEAARNQGITP